MTHLELSIPDELPPPPNPKRFYHVWRTHGNLISIFFFLKHGGPTCHIYSVSSSPLSPPLLASLSLLFPSLSLSLGEHGSSRQRGMRKPRRRQGGSGCGTPRQRQRQWQRGMQRPRRQRGMKRLRRRRLRDTKVAAMEVWDAEAAATTTVLCLSVDFAATIFNLSIR